MTVDCLHIKTVNQSEELRTINQLENHHVLTGW